MTTTALVPVFTGDNGTALCNARDLHATLENGDHFATWIKERIEKYSFTEGEDFFGNSRKTRGRPATDYHLTLDMAKELAMVENNERGRQVRRYFIAIEKEARAKVGAGGTAPRLGRSLREDIRQAITAELAKALPAIVAPALPPPPARNYESANDLPFVNRLLGNNSEWQFWFFKETKGSWAEAEAVGEFHWQEFCHFARGQQPNREREAHELLRNVFDYMARWYGQHPTEAEVFRNKLIVELVSGLRQPAAS